MNSRTIATYAMVRDVREGGDRMVIPIKWSLQ